MRRKILSLTVISVFMLSACGVKGSLKQPDPIWGPKTEKPAQQPQESDTESDTDNVGQIYQEDDEG